MKTPMKRLVGLSLFVLPLSIGMLSPMSESSLISSPTRVQAVTITPRDHAIQVIDTLAMQYPDDTLPTYILTPDLPEYITAATTGGSDQDNFNIFYYAEDKPIAVNDPAVNELDPIASLEKTTYDNEEDAIATVNQILNLEGQEVDLGYDITGYMEGAAGSSYLNWQEGNWSLVVQASNIDGEDPVPLAKEVVEYLEEVFLPAPSQVGQISLRVNSDGDISGNTVVWQEGNVVYRIQHEDAMHAVIMAGSISEPTEQ